jgi:hypothetical protein
VGGQFAGGPAVALRAGVVEAGEPDGLALSFVLGGDGVERCDGVLDMRSTFSRYEKSMVAIALVATEPAS